MTRRLLISGVVLAVLALLTVWIVNNTYWDEISVPSPLRGEAARDPHYAAKALVRTLGGEVSAATLFASADADGVIYLTGWNWNLGDARRRELQRWVEAGGRLVMDESVSFLGEEFTAWSGITPAEVDEDDPAVEALLESHESHDDCELLNREGQPVLADEGPRHAYLLCDFAVHAILHSARPAVWSLRDEFGMHAVRVMVGRGSVTLLRAYPFAWQELLRDDHAELFVAATQLRRGDHVRFLSERDHPSLLALTWQFGWPAILIGAVALALLLWRWGARFGPMAAAIPAARRSLAEQIRGTGRFVLHRGGGAALVGACARSLDAAARHRVPGYDSLGSTQRISAIAAATGANETALAQALGTGPDAGPRSIIAAIVHLETIRRRLLSSQPRRTHGS